MLDNINLNQPQPIIENVAGLITIIIFVCSIFGFFKYWNKIFRFIKLIYYKYFPFFTFNVAIYIEADNQNASGNFNKELKKELARSVSVHGLSKIIKLKDYEDLKLFSNLEEATKYAKNKELDLIIWGDFSTDGLRHEGKDISCINLHFVNSPIYYIHK